MHPNNEKSTPERKGKAIKVFTPAIQIKYPERNGHSNKLSTVSYKNEISVSTLRYWK